MTSSTKEIHLTMANRKHPYVYMEEKTINPFLLCCVCEKPFVDPVTADDTRRGCRSCLAPTSKTVTPIQEWIVLQMLDSLMVQCLQCGEISIRRGDLPAHEQRSCKRAVVSCKAADIKCPWRGAREQLERHVAECVFEPLRPAFSELMTENKEIQGKINNLELLLKELKAKK